MLPYFKGIYISKALTCMKFFLYKQKLLFYQGDEYIQLLSNRQYAYQPFRVISWFDTVCNIVTRWVNFRENHLHEHELKLSDYNV